MSTRRYPSFPQQRYLTTSSDATAFGITAGRKAVTNSGGRLFLSGSSVHRIALLDGARGGAFQFFGTADNQTFSARLWVATFPMQNNFSIPNTDFSGALFCDLNLHSNLNVTLSAAAGVSASDIISTSELLADTLANVEIQTEATVPKGIGSDAQTAYGLGAIADYSPGGDVPATYIVPNFGSLAHGFVWEFDLTGAAAANVLYTLTP